jgi:HrpA-like RNA helicase
MDKQQAEQQRGGTMYTVFLKHKQRIERKLADANPSPNDPSKPADARTEEPIRASPAEGAPQQQIGEQRVLDALFEFGVHLVAAELSFPIYAQSYEMLDKLRTTQVLAVPSDTGSGKSTLLPMLLVAEYGGLLELCL